MHSDYIIITRTEIIFNVTVSAKICFNKCGYILQRLKCYKVDLFICQWNRERLKYSHFFPTSTIIVYHPRMPTLSSNGSAIYHPSGFPHTIEVSALPVADPGGNILPWPPSSLDIDFGFPPTKK